MIKGFRHVCIAVTDLETSLRFYRDIIGLKVQKVRSLKGSYLERVFNKKGIRLTYVKMYGPRQRVGSEPVFELHCWGRSKRAPRTGQGHISFTVTDIDREYKRLLQRGVRFVARPIASPRDRTKICFCRDPEGNLIELIEDV